MKTKLPVTITKGLQLQNNATHKTLNKLYITIASIWRVNMLGYVSADITCPEKWTVSESKIRGKLSRWASWSGYCPRTNTWAYQVQSQMRAFVFIILEIFFGNTLDLEIGEILRAIIFPGLWVISVLSLTHDAQYHLIIVQVLHRFVWS